MERMDQTDESLMRAVRNGDVGELGTLFERHHVPLFQFFCRVTGSRTAADDLVQDVFFRMLKYRGSFRDAGRFRAWMFRIARNARADYFRKQPVIPASEDDDYPSDAPVPGDQLERDENTTLLERALAQLPEEKRELLVVARYQELKYEEIAELLEVSVGAVKVRVHRAVKDLRNIFLKLSNREESCIAKKSETSLPSM